MKFFSSNTGNFKSVLKKYFSFKNETTSLEPLSEFLEAIKKSEFTDILNFFKQNQNFAENFRYYLYRIFSGKPFNLSLTEASILSENAFVPELKKRILNKILPPVEHENTVWYLIDNVSFRPKKDLEYFQNLPDNELNELMQILGIADFIKSPEVKNELVFSMNILSWRVTGMALEVEVIKMAPEYRNFDNPFLALQNELESLAEDFNKKPQHQLNSKDSHYKQIKIYIQQCLDFVNIAFKNSSKYGISGKINHSLLKIRQQVSRILEILNLLVIDNEQDVIIKSKQLIFNILIYKSHKNNVRDLVNDSTTLISHLITSHTAETGSGYITSSPKEYFKMFRKAAGGGVIVGALCILKMIYSYIPGSEFSHAFLYSFNYVMGFVMIFLMGFALATKQPSMTATTMARVLSDVKNTKRNYWDFAHLVSKLFRSQFIAFMGNVLMSFPVAMIIIYALDVLLGINLATEKSDKFLKNLNFITSSSIAQGALTGVYLFISGIISGSVGNKTVFFKIPQRIEKNPLITNTFGHHFAKRLSSFYARNWAGIMSYLWLGVLMGITASVGSFLGLNIDTKHISFEAGNLALGIYGQGFNVDLKTILMGVSTVFLIGFANFSVSFGLSMLLAFRSRKITSLEIRKIISHIIKYFGKNPVIFFFPIRSILDENAKKLIKETTKSEDQLN
ncbi:Site-specific recombinase [Chryseobacterium taeanense]|uniref:Site-specific recombinase n=1 Tax=Chryseobacterium taeanense TaxID=311334 RepID=A0A1G8NE35_9FLAO|nr:recombinase [Chryseobacterium taeanense]SDI78327.1 Site-specific recombinase [Chryseobacterium taeanense]